MWRDFFIAVASGIIAGIFILCFDKVLKKLNKFIEQKRGYTPIHKNSNTILTDKLIESLTPGRNYSIIKDIFGLPDKEYNDFSIFIDEDKSSYSPLSSLYFLKNCILKVTTIDQRSICSITVFTSDNKITIPKVLYTSDENRMGKARISKPIIENVQRRDFVRTIRENSLAIQNYTGYPFEIYITYFCYNRISGAIEEFNLYNAKGDLIEGFCLSNLSDQSFFIFTYEMN